MKITLLLPVLAATMLSSCAHQFLEIKPGIAVNPKENSSVLYEWSGDALAGPVSVRISLAEQKAYFTRDGKDAGWSYIAAGKPANPTPKGSFKVMEKIAKKHSNKYGMILDADGDLVNTNATAGRSKVPAGGKFYGAPMPYWHRLTSYGIGMHAGPIPDPGYPASHGCIRFPHKMAEKLFEVTEVGTPVVIE